MRQSPDIQFLAERRRFPRYVCMGKAEILQSGMLWGWGSVDEISRCGCYINTSHPLPSGTQAQLRLTIADSSLNVAAKVVCTTPQVGMGMDFIVETQEQRNKVARIVEEVKATLLPSSAVLRIGARPKEEDPMLAAMSLLHAAQLELQNPTHDEAGHHARALQSIENAIFEVKKCAAMGARRGTIIPASMMSDVNYRVQ